MFTFMVALPLVSTMSGVMLLGAGTCVCGCMHMHGGVGKVSHGDIQYVPKVLGHRMQFVWVGVCPRACVWCIRVRLHASVYVCMRLRSSGCMHLRASAHRKLNIRTHLDTKDLRVQTRLQIRLCSWTFRMYYTIPAITTTGEHAYIHIAESRHIGG